MSPLATALYDLIERLAAETDGDDEALAELLPPHLLATLIAVVGTPRVFSIFASFTRELESVPAALTPKPRAQVAPRVVLGAPCARLGCPKEAVREVWHPTLGGYQPLCAFHSQNALPTETRPVAAAR